MLDFLKHLEEGLDPPVSISQQQQQLHGGSGYRCLDPVLRQIIRTHANCESQGYSIHTEYI